MKKRVEEVRALVYRGWALRAGWDGRWAVAGMHGAESCSARHATRVRVAAKHVLGAEWVALDAMPARRER